MQAHKPEQLNQQTFRLIDDLQSAGINVKLYFAIELNFHKNELI
jgi:hypothetical protein